MRIIRFLDSDVKRFWSKVNILDDTDCHEWLGTRDKEGYGHFKFRDGRSKRAHRLAWEIHTCIRISNLLQCLHICDNPSCVNWRHLCLGTALDNQRDKWLKERGPIQNGSKNPYHKLVEEEVVEIRNLRILGWTLIQIANKFNISFQHVSDICKRKTWKHI